MKSGGNFISGLHGLPADIFGARDRPSVALAPGRVNLIGEHTDYNDGWVLPMAIDRHVGVAAVPRGDRVLRAHAVAFGETREGRLDELAPPGGGGWFDYAAGTAWAMRAAGLQLTGADLVVDGNLPLAAGLSSSAALESGDLRAAGKLMDASHQGLRELYEVSSFELDLITEIARRGPGCFGARLTGAGFGGCAIALVAADLEAAFVEEVGAGYRARVGLPSGVFKVRAGDGAHLLPSAGR